MKLGIKILLPIAIFALAFLIALYQIKHKPVPEKKEKSRVVPMVRTVPAETGDFFSSAEGFGVVQAARSLNIVSDVSGRAVFVNPAFKPGAVFRKGEVFFSIEKIAYESALSSASASLRQAELQLAKTEQEADVSVKEWEIWNTAAGKEAVPGPLVKYEPQLKSAQADVENARKAVEKAKNDLEKTVFTAPFDCIVSAESVEAGTVIRAGESVGSLIGINEYEAVVPVSSQEESGIIVSGNRTKASSAKVMLTEGETRWEWDGYVSRVLPDADAKTGMTRVIVTIPEPNEKKGGRPSLPVGSNVRCFIKGHKISGLTGFLKEGLRENDTVWVLEKDILKIKTVEVAGRMGEKIFVSSGVNPGEQIIISRVQGALDGMKVRPAGDMK